MKPSGAVPLHRVQFYDDPRALEGALASYLQEGLERGERALVIAWRERWEAIAARLAERGHDVGRLRAAGDLAHLDGEAVLAELRVGPAGLDAARFDGLVGARLRDLSARGPVRVYGELVDHLVAGGAPEAALELEGLWNVLLARTPATLLCAYGMAGFAAEERVRVFDDVCGTHTHVSPAQELLPPHGEEASRRLARLERDAAALHFELERRRRSEQALELLAAAGGALTAAALEEPAIVDAVLGVALPALGDFGLVDLIGDDGEVRRASRAHADARAEALLRGTRWTRAAGALNTCALSSGRPGLHRTTDDAWLRRAATSPEHLALLRALGPCSLMTVPIEVRGAAVGALTLCHGTSGRRHDQRDLALAIELARRAGGAIHGARLHRETCVALERQREADRRKDEFLAVLGHELRNPLAPILTALDLMARRDGGSCERERAIIDRQARHLTRLVDDLLDVARIERGKVELAREPVAVDALVARAVELVQPHLARADHTLRVDVAAGLRVHGDVTRLTQALGNLLVNAAKYTPDGGHVGVRARREGGHVVVEVIDDGIGLAPDLLRRVFAPFVQGPRELDRAGGGLGVGLALARRLVELHEGTLEAHSDGPGCGARFVLRLPALPDEATDPEDTARLGVVRPQPERRVLVVDDNADAADMLAEALRASGFDVAVAYDPHQALALVGAFAPHTALIDLGLPGIDGLELAARVRASAPPSMRLVALTGYGQEEDRARTRAAGFDLHLVKPAALGDVLQALAPA